MKNTLAAIVVSLIASLTFAPIGAHADEPAPELPMEVASCIMTLGWRDIYAVPLGGETLGVLDHVCLAFDQVRPPDAEPGDIYYYSSRGPDPATFGPPPPEALLPPSDVRVDVIGRTFARVAGSPVGLVRVTYAPVPKADRYVIRCGEFKEQTTKTKARVKARMGSACKVRAHGGSGASAWSKRVRVR